MEDLIQKYIWYIIGFFTIPFIKLIIPMFKRFFKSTKHTQKGEKENNTKNDK